MNTEKTNSNIELFIMSNEQWQPLDKIKEYDVDSNIDLKQSAMSTYEFKCKNINEEIITQLKPQEEYTFMIDNGYKLKGTIKQKHLWVKYYWKKKGKRYKRFIKQSKQVVMEFEGKVVDQMNEDEILELKEYHFKKIKKLCQIYANREIDYKTGFDDSGFMKVCELIKELECDRGRRQYLYKWLFSYDVKIS